MGWLMFHCKPLRLKPAKKAHHLKLFAAEILLTIRLVGAALMAAYSSTKFAIRGLTQTAGMFKFLFHVTMSS